MRKILHFLCAFICIQNAGGQTKKFLPEIIDTGITFGVTISPEEDELFFVRFERFGEIPKLYTAKKNGTLWGTPSIVNFSGKPAVKDLDPVLSPDGKKLFFISNRNKKDQNDFDIWHSFKVGGKWSEPIYLDGTINSDSSESFASIAASGNIYFATRRKGSFGETDIYVSRFMNSKYQAAENLGVKINSQYKDQTPFISPDEKFLIFASHRKRGFGDLDLFISFRINVGWTTPQNLGPNVNSLDAEYSPSYRNGKLYFSRSSKQNEKFNENIFTVNFDPEQYRRLVLYEPKMFAEGIVSTGNGFSTAFEKDGKKVYFVKSSDEYKIIEKIYSSQQLNGKWQPPQLEPFSDIDNFVGTPFINQDGTIMLFAAQRNKMDLFIRYKNGTSWSAPQKLPGKVNTVEQHEYFGTLSNNRTLYFASSGGLGGGDIFVSKFVNGEWQEPQPIVELNTPQAESNPLIAPDESFLVFMAKRPEGFGDFDLYISFNENGKWSTPLNLGPNINTGVKDFQPAFSPDGKYLFFSRVPWPSELEAMYGNEYIYYIDRKILPTRKSTLR